MYLSQLKVLHKIVQNISDQLTYCANRLISLLASKYHLNIITTG